MTPRIPALVAAAALTAACPSAAPLHPRNEVGSAPAASAPRPSAPAPAATAAPIDPDDADGDGVSNDVDQCPSRAEDRRCVYEDGPPECCGSGDGCPHLDPDADGVPFASDACPDVAEDWNERDDHDGCPDARAVESERAIVAGKRDHGFAKARVAASARLPTCNEGPELTPEPKGWVLVPPVQFLPRSTELHPSAASALDTTAASIREQDDLLWVDVQGYAPPRTPNAVRLSKHRAEIVVEELVKRGALREALGAVGYGSHCVPEKGHPGRDLVTFNLVFRWSGATGPAERGCARAAQHGILPPRIAGGDGQ